MIIDASGMVDVARYVPSPNCDERPVGEKVALLVIHCISLPPGEYSGDAIERLFANTLDHAAHPYYRNLIGLRVSAHFLVRRSGELIQFVACGQRAWHAGASSWQGRERCNDFSIGIELEGSDDALYTNDQYRALADLSETLLRAYPITDTVGHSDIAPGRKTDPGPGFDWGHYRALLGRGS